MGYCEICSIVCHLLTSLLAVLIGIPREFLPDSCFARFCCFAVRVYDLVAALGRLPPP